MARQLGRMEIDNLMGVIRRMNLGFALPRILLEAALREKSRLLLHGLPPELPARGGNVVTFFPADGGEHPRLFEKRREGSPPSGLLNDSLHLSLHRPNALRITL